MTIPETLAKLGISEKEFTPDELEAIEAEASSLSEESPNAEHAVARAIKNVVPTRAVAKSSIGGNYMWSKNSDGTYNIFDVPVFAKHVRKLGMKLVADQEGNPKIQEVTINVDEKWLSKAIEINRTRYSDGKYMGPVHIRHHPRKEGEPDTTENAGFFLLKYVKPAQFEGETIPMLYVDFIKIPADIFEQRIKTGRLPYRSIESLPPNFEEIDSIALMDTDVPYFRLPMLTPGKEIQREVYMATTGDSPFRGFAKRGAAWSALFYQAGETFEEKKEKPDKKDEDHGEPDSDDKKSPMAAGMDSDDDSGITDDMDDDKIEGKLGGDTMSKILDALQSLAKTNEMILAKLGGAATPPTQPPAGAPVTETAQSKSGVRAYDAAKGAALEAIVYGMKQDEELKVKVDKAFESLAQYSLTPDAKAKLLAQVKASKDPDQVISVYVETIKAHAPMMPTPYMSVARTGVPGVPAGASVPEEIKEFFTKSPETGEKALHAWEAYPEAQKLGIVPRGMSRKDFVKFNVNRDYSALVVG